MRIKIYILTYRRPDILNETLKSLFASNAFMVDSDNIEVNVINNHSEFSMTSEFEKRVKVLHNNLRSDLSTGHLARSWNQALIFGFRDLKNPDCDLVITLQDDVILEKHWLSNLKNLHDVDGFSFVQAGHGDALCSYTAEAVRKVGLWDERYLMGLQASDYFYRQLMFNWDGCSIMDSGHRRVHNQRNVPIVKHSFEGRHWPDPGIDLDIGTKLSEIKYGSPNYLWPWTEENKQRARTMKFKNYNFIFYPYFEKDVYDLEEKGYLR